MEEQVTYRNIAVFGGTFDPPHLGHASVAAFVASSGRFDTIFVFPTFQHPHGKKPVATYDQRLSMCYRAFDFLEDAVSVVDTERFCKINQCSERAYDLMTAVAKRPLYPASARNIPTFLLGQDISDETIRDTWYKGPELLKEFDIMRFPRGTIPCSSSSIRESFARLHHLSNCAVAEDEKLCSIWLNRKVYSYIQSKEIYK